MTYSKRRFSRFTKFVSRSVFGELRLMQISLNFQSSCCKLKMRGQEQICEWLSYYFYFQRSYDILKSKSPCFLLNKNINFNKNKTKPKMENLNTQFYRNKPCASACIRIGARKKKSLFFVIFILSEGNFSILSQYRVNWMNSQTICTFTYQKTLSFSLPLLVFNTVERLHCILKNCKKYPQK